MMVHRAGWAARPLSRMLGVLAIALPLAACDTDELLEVDEPTFAPPESLRNQAGLQTLFLSALGDFQVGYSGAGLNDAYLSNVSLFADELRSSDTFTTRNATDQRLSQPVAQGNTSDLAYNQLQYARRSAHEVADVIVEIADSAQADARWPRLKALEAFAIVALGEGFCGAVPLGFSNLGVPGDYASPLMTEELFEEAVRLFDEALAAIGPRTTTSTAHAAHLMAYRLASVGKGRALLNNGDPVAAAAAVAAVPTSFIYLVEHSATAGRQYNPIYALQDNRRYTMTHDTVNDREGGNGMPYVSTRDPRTPWYRHAQIGFDGTTPVIRSGRYTSYAADVVLADGIQARLIEAEAALATGGDWLAILNDLRANVTTLMAARYPGQTLTCGGAVCATLEPLVDPGTDAARVDMLFRERAFWLYLTGTRLGDLRRLVRDYGRLAESVFPSGAHHKLGEYGPDVNLPVPFNEQQNPNFSASMCSTTQP